MAIEFGAVADEHINCQSGASLDNIFDGGGTIAVWTKLDTFGELSHGRITEKTHTVFQVRDDGGAGSSDSVLRLFRGWSGTNGVWHTGTGTISTGVWIHVAVAYNSASSANKPQFYIDGSSVVGTTQTSPTGTLSDDSAEALFIGTDATLVTSFDGQMEDLRMFTRVLSAAEVALLAAGYRGPIGDEVLWLDVDGTDAQVASSNYVSIMDKTVYKNHGTPQGAPVYRASKAPRYG